ncbi:MAG: acyl-CoA dehydrogenase [Actinobacteria bacterium]|nr:acyl-CoA dehydrogenase [Actinomycetota bacterium]
MTTVDETRAALAALLRPRDAREPVTVLGAGRDDLDAGRAYLVALADGGWAVPTWPLEYGGRDANPEEAAVVARELARFEQPDLYPFLVGIGVVGPTLLTCASKEQQSRWLPAIRSGAEIWCQLFSEPGAGSDLAGLATRAERDGDIWRVTGQKVWSSRAHYAKWGFLLARTDPTVPKHSGITAFAIDMQAPGVDIRPLRQMNGDAHFSEVFLEDAAVSDSDRIGDVGAGWNVTRTALANERGAVGAAGTGMGSPAERLLELCRDRAVDPVARDRVTSVHVMSEVNRLTTRRARDAAKAGTPGPEGSGAKLRGGELFKETARTALGLLGAAGSLDEGEWSTLFLTAPSISIRGGTDEIQRNIVGERVLGLPVEPRTDADRPWNELPH